MQSSSTPFALEMGAILKELNKDSYYTCAKRFMHIGVFSSANKKDLIISSSKEVIDYLENEWILRANSEVLSLLVCRSVVEASNHQGSDQETLKDGH